jgi:hypothetical protein
MDNKTRAHIIYYSNHGWHIYWNLFACGYKRFGIKPFWMPYSKYLSIAFYFGKGEFVIDFPSIKRN